MALHIHGKSGSHHSDTFEDIIAQIEGSATIPDSANLIEKYREDIFDILNQNIAE
jgi:hypothetical protein